MNLGWPKIFGLLLLTLLIASSLLYLFCCLLFSDDNVQPHKLSELHFTPEQCQIPLANRPPHIESPAHKDIWGLVQVLPVWEIRKIFDSSMTRECLRKKRVLLLGDSTMSELAHDLTLLLGDADPIAQIDYVTNVTHSKSFNLTSKSTPVGAITIADVHTTYRNMTVYSAASHTHLRFRFTGHHNLTQNREGIATFFHPDFHDELDALLAFDPDIIVVNSGLHDSGLPGEFFENSVKLLADRLRTTRARVLWKGNVWLQKNKTRDQELAAYDEIAHREFKARGLDFVNISHVVRQLYCNPELQSSDLMPVDDDQHHYGAIMYYHNTESTPIIGAHITQAVLNSLCSI